MEALHALVAQNAVMVSGIILLIAYIFIATEKISKVTVALIGASLTILLGLVTASRGQEAIPPHYFANFIDFNVIFLLISMMIIVHIAAQSGMFNWVANELLRFTKGHPIKILVALGIFTAIASAFLDNVTTVILIMPVTFVIAKELEIDPIPYLMTEILASNIGGTATLIGDPPNIIIGSKAGFSFMDFINELTGVVAVILAITIAILIFVFKSKLKATPENMNKVANLDNSKTITDKRLLIRSGLTLLFVIIGFMLHDITHIETYLMAMMGASFLLIFEKPQGILEAVEWNTIFFFVGLFIIIGGLEASGGIKLMAEWLLNVTNGSESATAMIILWGSGILSGIIDNIPYTATMAPLIYQIQVSQGVDYAYPLWWCLALGACLGGNATIIGAAANVIVSETAAAKGFKITFMRYLKYGLSVMLISLIISTIFVYFKYLAH